MDPQGGAGIHLEATRFGYLVDQVEERPGQELVLQPGRVIVRIDSVALLGLAEEELEAQFASVFRSGASLHVADWSSLCAAEIQHEAALLGEWHEDEDVEKEQSATLQTLSPFLREQMGAAELRVTVGGEVSTEALKKLQSDVALALRTSHPHLYVIPSRMGSIIIRGDVRAVRGVVEGVEELVQKSGATLTIEDELFIKMLNDEARLLLLEDLCVLGERFCIGVDLCCPPHEDDSVVLVGGPCRMRCAAEELKHVLSFHGIEPTSNDRSKDHNACAVEDTLHEAEDLEREALNS